MRVSFVLAKLRAAAICR